MRFGLVGTGHWARTTHAAGLQAASGLDLTTVWGRDFDKAQVLAQDLGIRATRTYAELLDEVDAVAFAVPPAVQTALAVEAAVAGRHLLLEKPIALDVTSAAAIRDAVQRARVAAVVFFTARFDPAIRSWLPKAAAETPQGAWARWIVPALSDPNSPYRTSTWRWEAGALWDIGPHALSLLVPLLGPVSKVHATKGAKDLVHLTFDHEGGATSTASMTLQSPVATTSVEMVAWGEAGLSRAPLPGNDVVPLLTTAAIELADQAEEAPAGEQPTEHPCGVVFGEQVVAVLASAAAQLGL